MSEHRFILKPYKSRADRKECPNCHVKGCFSQYIDTEGRIAFPPDVGRCNREHKCGYHYTPKQFFHDHPDMKEELMDDANPSNSSPAQGRAVLLPSLCHGEFHEPLRGEQLLSVPMQQVR